MKWRFLVIPVVVLASINLIGLATGMLQIYRIPSNANEPGLKQGSYAVGTNLAGPKPGKFVVFCFDDPHMGRQILTYRYCAGGDDTVLIINGEVFVNGELYDDDRPLQHIYRVEESVYNRLLAEKVIARDDFFHRKEKNGYLIFLEDRIAREYNAGSARKIDTIGQTIREIEALYGQPWNKDQFGPYVVPRDSFFVLGDNRDNSLDSRYIGAISNKSLIGVILK